MKSLDQRTVYFSRLQMSESRDAECIYLSCDFTAVIRFFLLYCIHQDFKIMLAYAELNPDTGFGCKIDKERFVAAESLYNPLSMSRY